jgi:hypothetical protein
MNEHPLDWLDRKAAALADTPEELERLRDDLRRVARNAFHDHVAAAIQVRKVVDHMARRVHQAELGDPGEWSLCDVIEALRTKNRIPQTIASYLHTIRRIGNDAAHNEMTRDDLYAGVMLLLRVSEWYFCAYENGPRSETIYRLDAPPDPAPAVSAFDDALEHAHIVEELLALAETHPDDFRVDLWIEKEEPTMPRRDFAPDPADGAPRFHLNERAVICARAERDCRLWIVDVGTTGKTALVFPRAGDGDNQVKAAEVVRIPGRLTGRAGLETVHAFASTGELPLRRASSPAAAAVRDFLADEREVRQDLSARQSAAVTLQFAIDDTLQ